jgi:sec-independent protein translocase protein TatC
MKDDDIDDSTAPLIEHLAELRARLIYSILSYAAAMVACFTVAGPIFDFLARPLAELLVANGQEPDLIFTGLQQGFMTQIRISLFGGFVLAFPMIAYQMWRFVAPGLYRQEKNAFLPFLLASPALFLLGASFAYYIVLPLAFDFFLGFQDLGSDFVPGGSIAGDGGQIAPEGSAVSIQFLGTINEYLGLTMKFVIAFGLCFQLPVLLTLMGKANLVSAKGLGEMRKYAIVGILVLAAVVTPPDVVTQVILFVVVYGLYEISILLVRMVERRREADLRAQGLWDDDLATEPTVKDDP